MMRVLCALPILLAASGRADDSAASRLRSEHATAVLEAVVGPGRGRVVVDAATERVETRAEFDSAAAAAAAGEPVKAATPLPGYSGRGPLIRSRPPLEAQGRARTVHAASAELTRQVKATLFVDEALSEDLVRQGARAVSEVLGLDEARGDDLKLVRAPLHRLPPPAPDERARAGLALAAAAVLAALLLLLGLRGAASRVAGALSARSEPAAVNVHVAPPAPTPLEVHVPAPPAAPAPRPAPGAARKIEILPRMGERRP